MWCCSLMVSALDSRLSSQGSSSGREHCVVSLGQTFDSSMASVHPCVSLGGSKFNAGGNPAID